MMQQLVVSQWSLTFEVRKRWCGDRFLRTAVLVVAMEPDL